MEKYLGFVVVYNLLPTDYTDEPIGEIENVINGSISYAADGRFHATEENMLFSFPSDPSVKSAEIPVVVDIRFLGLANINLEERNEMADLIRANLLLILRRRGGVAVSVSNPGPTASFSPRD